MFALLRLSVVGFIVLTIIYVCVSLYSRSVRRDKLEAEWAENDMVGDGAAWVEKGLKEYDASLRRKLILAVYVVPILCVAAIIYVINFY
ncbi:hypothetical protein Q8W37_03155 [Shimia thalassica]|jgi:uncharacterized ion transporter superfamily protein YfcC|uniref:hypothetical protein n=1 Tax=Shimia thalassica TaxID=1715693 RepID=UPI000C086A96|nr:hypothetical protein [Shimia thalassica]PHO04679.1 hypothetical protein CSC82_08560 [Rhodobacteraceae bacterium 4F10]MBU2943334.1 hypothetical protein [Shimia thalassica]MDO6478863.1 hypothetical protein [Shimia thalassica]MDO6501403.1 hypothetical protein [Shimia thalassica]MDO6521955.1 hypothetical protein [Shimia thalassica]